MESIALLLQAHGYPVLFAIVFLEAIGLPVPAAPALLIAGGACGNGLLDPARTLGTALAAMLTADLITFTLGRYTGWWLLGILCRLSLNPEACILRSADSFYRRGRMFLLFAKFVPGLNSLAPPIAGSLNMRFAQFAALDCAGASLYIGFYWGIGFVFSDVLQRFLTGYEAFGKFLIWGFGAAFLVYLATRARVWAKGRILRTVPRVKAGDVAGELYREGGEEPGGTRIFDVRSHGYYERNAMRIRGSRRMEPNAFNQEKPDFGGAKKVILYCTCIREETSVRMAHMLREQGIETAVIEGGLREWKKAGLPLETIPEDERVMLPSFGTPGSR